MKIGILTFHRANNYGAVLQCYALQEYLNQIGYEAFVVDYRQTRIEKAYKFWRWDWFAKKILFPNKLYQFFKYVKKSKVRKKFFDNFRHEYLNLTKKCTLDNIPMYFDRYVIGSDQVLSESITGELDPIYAGDFSIKENALKIAYAVGTNKKSIDNIDKYEWLKILDNFDSFSLREKSLANYLSQVVGKDIDSNIDPTLLHDKIFWERLCIEGECFENKIVVYQVRDYNNISGLLLRKAEKIAKIFGLEVVDLSRYSYSVNEWISYIRNAKCVLTTSFHAVAFALIFERPLYAVKLGDGHDDRYVDLLKACNADHFIYDVEFDPKSLPSSDYTGVNECLNRLSSFSKNSLKISLT